MNKAKELVEDFPIIRVMDHGYNSLSALYHSSLAEDKFVIRLTSSNFKAEQAKMDKDDGIAKVEE